MATRNFTSPMKYKKVKLKHPSDVVKHSFIVQNSISHLDLDISPSYRFRTLRFRYYPKYSPYSMINTEEKCQKLHSESRSLLYNLHLDLPKAREWSLKSESLPEHLETSADTPCLSRIEISDYFYFEILNFMIIYVCTHPSCINTYQRIKAFKWYMNLDELKRYNRLYMPLSVLKDAVDFMQVEFTDLEFVENCLKKLHFGNILEDDDKPERVENLLYLVHRLGSRLDREFWRCDFSDRCFLHLSFEYVRKVLKFSYAPHLCTSFMRKLGTAIFIIRRGNPLAHILLRFRNKSERRRALLMHLHWTYLYRPANPPAASETLRLVWSSVNDSFFSCDEVAEAFQTLDPEEAAGIWDFYCEAVGECHDDINPRSLKHICRSAIRYRLWESMQWLPEGIDQLDIPTALKSYLKLEM